MTVASVWVLQTNQFAVGRLKTVSAKTCQMKSNQRRETKPDNPLNIPYLLSLVVVVPQARVFHVSPGSQDGVVKGLTHRDETGRLRRVAWPLKSILG